MEIGITTMLRIRGSTLYIELRGRCRVRRPVQRADLHLCRGRASSRGRHGGSNDSPVSVVNGACVERAAGGVAGREVGAGGVWACRGGRARQPSSRAQPAPRLAGSGEREGGRAQARYPWAAAHVWVGRPAPRGARGARVACGYARVAEYGRHSKQGGVQHLCWVSSGGCSSSVDLSVVETAEALDLGTPAATSLRT